MGFPDREDLEVVSPPLLLGGGDPWDCVQLAQGYPGWLYFAGELNSWPLALQLDPELTGLSSQLICVCNPVNSMLWQQPYVCTVWLYPQEAQWGNRTPNPQLCSRIPKPLCYPAS